MVSKKLSIYGVGLIILVVANHFKILSGIANFMMTGTIPSLSITIPFWAMIAVYCLIATIILTIYIESAFKFFRTVNPSPRQQLPRRRYNHTRLTSHR